jgi:(2R)-ethylmalonyl-CoA mutase
VQLPAWNEALGLPRPWDQQWSLRLQQIVAYETDLLEYDDIFNGSPVIEAKVLALMAAAKAEMQKIEDLGGAVAAVESSYMKRELVASHARRIAAIENGDLKVIGVNVYKETEPCPLTAGMEGGILKVDAMAERDQIERLNAFRAKRNQAEVERALTALKDAARSGANIMPVSIQAAEAGVTTGEWAGALREIFGEYRAPTGVSSVGARVAPSGRSESGRSLPLSRPLDASEEEQYTIEAVRKQVEAWNEKHKAHLRILVGKPGLDGHSNGAEQIAVRARDVGMEVIYEGIRLTPEQIARSALQEGAHVVGLSILSGSHLELIPEVVRRMRELGLSDVPVVVGGIIPEEDRDVLMKGGVARVYTPKDFDLNRIMSEIVGLV